jgi:MFS-type transporter involved in bile tolerance (Atg22 family)
MGPVVFGLVSWLLSGNQRAAIVAVGLFFVVGFLLLGRVAAGGPTTRGRPASASRAV